MSAGNHMQQQFLEAYDQLGDRIYRFACARLSDHEAALDLTQEVFMRYWDYLQGGKSADNEQALLFTIARRLIIDRYRARRPSSSLDQLHEELGFDPADEHAPAPDAAAEGARALALLAQLPEEYCDVLLLRFVEGLEPRVVAETLGLSANVISVRIHRGIEKLRILMHANHYD